MHWRNIHIQNPYLTQTNQRQKRHSKRFNPKRSQNSQSRFMDSSLDSKSSKISKRSKDSMKQLQQNIPHKAHYVVTQSWLINLRKQINGLIKYSHSLCDFIKTYVLTLNKTLQQESQTIKQKIIEKMSSLTYQIAMINIPKIQTQGESQHDVSLGMEISKSTLKQLIKPFIMPQCDYQEEFGTSKNFNVSQKQDFSPLIPESISNKVNELKDNQQDRPEDKDGSKIKLQEVKNISRNSTLKKQCSISSNIEINGYHTHDRNSTNNMHNLLSSQQVHKRGVSESKVKLGLNEVQPTPENLQLETAKKQFKQKPTLQFKTTKQTATFSESAQQQKSEDQQHTISKLQSLKNSIRQEKMARSKDSRTQRKLSYNVIKKNIKKQDYPQPSSIDMVMTMNTMNNCIDTMKKILDKYS